MHKTQEYKWDRLVGNSITHSLTENGPKCNTHTNGRERRIWHEQISK